MSSASLAPPNIRYEMPKSRSRHSWKSAASSGRDAPSGRGADTRRPRRRRHCAGFGKALTAQTETGVEPGAKVLQGHPGRQLDDFRIAEMAMQLRRALIRHLGRIRRGLRGVLEHRSFAIVEQITLRPIRRGLNLPRVDPGIHALV